MGKTRQQQLLAGAAGLEAGTAELEASHIQIETDSIEAYRQAWDGDVPAASLELQATHRKLPPRKVIVEGSPPLASSTLDLLNTPELFCESDYRSPAASGTEVRPRRATAPVHDQRTADLVHAVELGRKPRAQTLAPRGPAPLQGPSGTAATPKTAAPGKVFGQGDAAAAIQAFAAVDFADPNRSPFVAFNQFRRVCLTDKASMEEFATHANGKRESELAKCWVHLALMAQRKRNRNLVFECYLNLSQIPGWTGFCELPEVQQALKDSGVVSFAACQSGPQQARDSAQGSMAREASKPLAALVQALEDFAGLSASALAKDRPLQRLLPTLRRGLVDEACDVLEPRALVKVGVNLALAAKTDRSAVFESYAHLHAARAWRQVESCEEVLRALDQHGLASFLDCKPSFLPAMQVAG